MQRDCPSPSEKGTDPPDRFISWRKFRSAAGLEHAEQGEDSIMQPDYPELANRGVDFKKISPLDLRRVCEINTCSPEVEWAAAGEDELAQSSLFTRDRRVTE
jgi:hypothetical protein